MCSSFGFDKTQVLFKKDIPVCTHRLPIGEDFQVRTLRPPMNGDFPVCTHRLPIGEDFPVRTQRPPMKGDFPVCTHRPPMGQDFPERTHRPPMGEDFPVHTHRLPMGEDFTVHTSCLNEDPSVIPYEGRLLLTHTQAANGGRPSGAHRHWGSFPSHHGDQCFVSKETSDGQAET